MQNFVSHIWCRVETVLVLDTGGSDLLKTMQQSVPKRSLCGRQKLSSPVTTSALRLVGTRSGGTIVMDMTRDKSP